MILWVCLEKTGLPTIKNVTLYLSKNSFLGKGVFVSPPNQTYLAYLET